MTRYLAFPDEARAIACLGDYYGADGWITGSELHALDVIGPIDDAGFHLNLLGPLPDKAAPFEVFPDTPNRVFAT